MHAFATACGVTALLATASAIAADRPVVDLWNGAIAGANIDEIAARFPQGKASTGQAMDDGSLSAFSTRAELGGAPAEAIFFFRNKGLDAVLVERSALPSGHSADNLADARRVVAAATNVYGPPKRCVERRELAALSCTWTTGPLKVAVSYHDYGGGSPALSVFYGLAP